MFYSLDWNRSSMKKAYEKRWILLKLLKRDIKKMYSILLLENVHNNTNYSIYFLYRLETPLTLKKGCENF